MLILLIVVLVLLSVEAVLLLRARRGVGCTKLRRRTDRSRADRRAAPLADRQHGGRMMSIEPLTAPRAD
jgi:hypothetical protein